MATDKTEAKQSTRATSGASKPKVKRAPKRTVKEQLADYRNVKHKRTAETKSVLRNKFKGVEYIRQLELAAKELDELSTALAACKTRRKALTRNQQEQIQATRSQIDIIKVNIDVVKTKIDLNLRRLKFVIPELKAMELTGDGEGNPLERLALSMAMITQSVSKH